MQITAPLGALRNREEQMHEYRLCGENTGVTERCTVPESLGARIPAHGRLLLPGAEGGPSWLQRWRA